MEKELKNLGFDTELRTNLDRTGLEIVKQRVALYEQYADGNMSKEEFIRQRDAYRVQEGEKME